MKTHARARARRWLALAIVTGLVPLVLGWMLLAEPAAAHGKQVDIVVTSLVPDADQPLLRLYRARVTYAIDGDPVEGATVVLTARRPDGAAAFPARLLTEIGGDPGLYIGEVAFERFGAWEISLSVEAELGQGEGSVTLADDILPESRTAAEDAARRSEAERVARLQLQFRFDWWPDIATIALRILHSLAGLAYFLVTGLALGLAWFGIPSRYPDFPRRLARVFLPAAVGSLGLLLVAGLYGAAFDAPVAFPGIYNVGAMRRIAYGDAYLLAFLFKVVLFGALIALTLRIHRTLRTWTTKPVQSADDPIVAVLRRATLVNAAVGVAVVVDVAVLVYLHYISHLGAFLPPQ